MNWCNKNFLILLIGIIFGVVSNTWAELPPKSTEMYEEYTGIKSYPKDNDIITIMNMVRIDDIIDYLKAKEIEDAEKNIQYFPDKEIDPYWDNPPLFIPCDE